MAPTIVTFGMWSSRGGAGKTTLAFHLSSLYAHLHPEKCVILIDMCPQADLSRVALTYGIESGSHVVRQLQAGASINVRDLVLPAMEVPRTVAGYLHTSLDPANVDLVNPPKNSDFIVNVSDVNPRCPSNVYLLCGDGRLEDMCADLRLFMNRQNVMTDGFSATLSKLRNMFKALQSEAGSPLQGQDIAVFVDTNPAFTEYTQLALCSMDKLVVPVNADLFPAQAVDSMFTRIWNLFGGAGLGGMCREPFAEKAAHLLPKLAAVVHNRHPVRAMRASPASQHLQDAAAVRLFGAFEVATADRGSGHVFVDKGRPNLDRFQPLYTSTVREMCSIGVAAAYLGIPLHSALDHQAGIAAMFHNNQSVAAAGVPPPLRDMVKLLSLLLDDFDLSKLSAQGTANLYAILRLPQGDRPALKRQLKWTARKRAWEASRAAAEGRPVEDVSDGEEDLDCVDAEWLAGIPGALPTVLANQLAQQAQ